MRKTDESDQDWIDRMVREGKVTKEQREVFLSRAKYARAIAHEHRW